VLTGDHDFLRLVHDQSAQQQRHPGLLFILPGTAVGEAGRAIALVAEALDPGEIESWVEWIP
jgi:hypothetical protein